MSPALEGEKRLSQRFTYLTERYGVYPAGTVVVERTTNRAVLYYVIVNARVTARRDLLLQEITDSKLTPRLFPTNESALFQDTATATASQMASDIAKAYLVAQGASEAVQAVLGAISGGIATLVLGGIFDLIFPSPEPDFFDYLQALGAIVQQQIETDTVVKINGVFAEIVQQIQVQYQPVRTDSTPLADPNKNATLAGFLTNYLDLLTGGAEGAIGTLQTPQYSQIGFPAFLFGATLHLSLLQEQANMQFFTSTELYDDDVKPGGSIATQAQLYVNHAIAPNTGVWPRMKASRRAQITINPVTTCIPLLPSGVTCTTSIEVDDQGAFVTQYVEAGKDSPAVQQANDYVTFYYWPLQLDTLAQSLNSPVSIVAAWQNVVAAPMGQSAGTWPPPAGPTPVAATRYIMIASQNSFLKPGDLLFSDDEVCRLVYQSDGNLVLYGAGGSQVWASHTGGARAWRTYMQPDGNFVAYASSGNPVFATGTQGNPDAYALVTEDGHFQIRSSGNPETIYWST
jgi:hypothetical protein